MNDVFKPFLRRFVLVFFDDIFVYCKTIADHVSHLSSVLTILQQHSLFVKMSKCAFGVTKVAYLGHIITGAGASMDMDKVEGTMTWPVPTNLKALRGFLGLTGYYQKFIRNYAQIAKPLTEQLRKDAYGWNEAAFSAFIALKQAMTQAPVLSLLDFSKLFFIETDASNCGLGAVLLQEQHLVAFFSKTLGRRASLKPLYEKELMAIVFAILKWGHYLLGRHFVFRTDQSSLKFLLEHLTKYQKWLTKIMGYDFEIIYNPGMTNQAADALSRRGHHSTVLGTMSYTYEIDWQQLNEAVEQDAMLNSLKQRVAANDHKGLYLAARQTTLQGQFLVTQVSNLLTTILEHYYDSPTGVTLANKIPINGLLRIGFGKA